MLFDVRSGGGILLCCCWRCRTKKLRSMEGVGGVGGGRKDLMLMARVKKDGWMVWLMSTSTYRSGFCTK